METPILPLALVSVKSCFGVVKEFVFGVVSEFFSEVVSEDSCFGRQIVWHSRPWLGALTATRIECKDEEGEAEIKTGGRVRRSLWPR